MFSGNRFIDEFSLTLLSLGGINLLSKLIKQGKGINMGEALIYDAVRTPRQGQEFRGIAHRESSGPLESIALGYTRAKLTRHSVCRRCHDWLCHPGR